MDEKTILVTGIGGNVGQGILRTIRSCAPNIRLIGCDIASFTVANHLCTQSYQVPYAVDPDYIASIQQILQVHQVDLIIPSTDFEVYILSKNRKIIKPFVLASDAVLSEQFLDKYLTYLLFQKHQIPFAKTWLVGDYKPHGKKILAKPRKGRGSRGIIKAPSLEKLQELDRDYIVQEYHTGTEITSTFYVSKKNKIHGLCTMVRELQQGTSVKVQLCTNYDTQLLQIAQQIVNLGGIIGSINIQSIVDSKGAIYPFEINGRISGTNSIRHAMGFKDVQYALQEYLWDQNPDPIVIKNPKAVAVRMLMDVIFKEETTFDTIDYKSDYYIY